MSLILNEDRLRELLTWITNKISASKVKADWGENDNTSDSYVQNRTHYTIPSDGELVTIYDDTLTFTYEYVNEVTMWQTDEAFAITTLPTAGCSGTVTIGDFTYTGEWFDEYGYICIGDPWDEYSTKTDFFQISIDSEQYDGNYYAYIYYNDNGDWEEGNTREFSVTFGAVPGDTVVQLDDKYLNITSYTSTEIFNAWNEAQSNIISYDNAAADQIDN